MSSVPPPNDELAELAAVLGDDNVRMLVRTFLRDFPVSFRELSGGDRKNRHRIAHSMKSNSRLVGAHELSKRMAALEDRLSDESGADVGADDLAAISQDFKAIEPPLREFVGP
ncbi:MAG: Hpt domain-containing protein [Opitutaceae bacterium]|nr:Hpt domain-containing protein [Opitutaceae bacterium]